MNTLVIALCADAAAAVYMINRLKPEALCFVLPDSAKALVEAAVQPQIEQMPRRWDWLVLDRIDEFGACYRILARALPDLLRTWEVRPGEVVVDLTGATPAVAGALSAVALPFTSRILSLVPAGSSPENETIEVGGTSWIWTQINPWDEAATVGRRDGCDLFNRGLFAGAATVFRDLEHRVSGGQKPLYRALADVADGYELWERFHYRQAWDKLKTAVKALDMAALWGGPLGLKAMLPPIKANASFLEKLVLDPTEVKEAVALDVLAHAGRRLNVSHDPEGAMIALLRALEAGAQRQLYNSHRIKSWDVTPEQLPQALQPICRSCYADDVDGKYKLPLQAQFKTLAELGDPLGQSFLREWPTLKPLFDAAHHAVLGHGFEPVKAERVQQLYDAVLKLTGIQEQTLPKFPTIAL